MLPVYTGHLAIAEYGALELFYTVMGVVSGLLSIGIAHATLRYYFEYDNEWERKELVTTNLITSLSISVLGGLLVLVFADTIMELLFQEAQYHYALYIIIATMVLELSSQVGLAYIRAKEYSIFFISVAIFKLIIQITINIYFVVYLSKGVEGVLFGNMIAVFVGWIVISWLVIKECGISFKIEKMINVVKYCAPLLISTIVAVAASTADRFLINKLLDIQHLGLYALAMKFALLIEVVIGEPFARSYGAYRFSIMKMKEAGQIQAKILKYLISVIGVCLVGIVYFAPDVVSVMSRSEYKNIDHYLMLACLAIAMRVINYPLQTGILYAKETKLFIKINAIEATTAIILNFLLIPAIGLYGACVSMLVSLAIGNIITHMASNKYFKVEYEYYRIGVLLLIILTFSSLYYLVLAIDIWQAFLLKILALIIMIITIYMSPVFVNTERKEVTSFIYKKLKYQLAF